MLRFFKPAVMSIFFALLAASFIAASANAQPSREVTPIDPPVPTPNDGTIEVLEFFAYGCLACANLEPALDDWAKTLPPDVKFRRVPSGFNFMGIDDIAVFHTLEAMGQLARLNKKIFEAAHNERVMLGHRPTYLKWLGKQGINTAQYESVEKSFSVQSKIMRGRGLAGLYKITSTPTIVVNGKFGAKQVGDSKVFLTGTVEQLIKQARAANSAQATAPVKAKPTTTPTAKPSVSKPVAPAPAKAPAPVK